MSQPNNRIAAEIAEVLQKEKNIKDIHLREGCPIFFNGPKGLQRSGSGDINREEIAQFFDFVSGGRQDGEPWRERIKSPSGDFNDSITLQTADKRLRVNGFEWRSDNLLGAAIRCLPLKVPQMDKLGVPEVMKFFLAHKGLVIITGPTGAGKSTTLASAIEYLNNDQAPYNIITVEDPIEYEIKSKNCLVTQREVGTGRLKTMADGVISALRQAPNVIGVGEMRDEPTISAALRAGSSGHLVLASMHTNSARDTVEAILSVYKGDEVDVKAAALASRLVGIISQQLVPLIDGTGYSLATEVLIVNKHVRNAIRGRNFAEFGNLMDAGRGDSNSYTLNSELVDQVKDNQISKEAAIMASYDPDDLKARLGMVLNSGA